MRRSNRYTPPCVVLCSGGNHDTLALMFKRSFIQIALGIAVIPTRRALAIQPTEALKDER